MCHSKYVSTFVSQQRVSLSFCMVMVLVMNIYSIGKEVVQISQQVLSSYGSVITSHKTCAHKSVQHWVCVDTQAIKCDECMPPDLDLQPLLNSKKSECHLHA